MPSTLTTRVLPPGTFYWPVTEDQAYRLSELLNVDFSELGVRGAFIGSPQLICSHCGKLSGMEDFIFEALQRGIHSPEFIVEDLRAGGKGQHSQILHCMDCGEAYMRSGTDEEVAAVTKRELERRAAGGDPAHFVRREAANAEAARAHWKEDWVITKREAGSDWRRTGNERDIAVRKRDLDAREPAAEAEAYWDLDWLAKARRDPAPATAYWDLDWISNAPRDVEVDAREPAPAPATIYWDLDWIANAPRDAEVDVREPAPAPATAYWDLDWISNAPRDAEIDAREPVAARSPWFADWVDVDQADETEVKRESGVRSLEELD